MILLNLGCGATRPGEPYWLNVDTLYAQLAVHPCGEGPLRMLKQERNYLDYDLHQMPWPWEDASVNGILASHFLEHFDCQEALCVLREGHRVLAPDGVLRISVPDAAYFQQVHPHDRRENWMALFGEGNVHKDHPAQTYMEIALFMAEHKQTFTEDALWCQLTQAGFSIVQRATYGNAMRDALSARELARHDNRSKFSLYMEAVK